MFKKLTKNERPLISSDMENNVKAVFSKDREYKFEIVHRKESTYQVNVYKKGYDEYICESFWVNAISNVIFADSIERANQIGNDELRLAGHPVD